MQHFHKQRGNSIIPKFYSKHTCKPSTKLVKIGSIFWSFYQVVNSVQMLAHFLLFFLGVTIIAPKLHTMRNKHLWSCIWILKNGLKYVAILSIFCLFVCLLNRQQGKHSPNISTTPLRQWGFWQCLPFSWTTLKGKHNGSYRYVWAKSASDFDENLILAWFWPSI